MCGIAGVAFPDPQELPDPAMLRRMTDSVHHRGPDSHGFYTSPGIGFGVRRLSIVDLETGDQPISNEDETVTVICNGEIYNCIELRQQLLAAGHQFRTQSDVEVIVHLYEDYGVECLRFLRGMFGFAVWDTRRRVLMLARDRLGIKPLHYALDTDALAFASEVKSLLATDRIERQLDVQALKDLFILGFIVTPKTLFSRVRQLPPGHYLLYQDGAASIHRYWDVAFPLQGQALIRMTAEEWSESLQEKLKESVRLHLHSDVPVGAWLSSGVDSSTVVSLMGLLNRPPVQTFTLTFENSDFDEAHGQKTLSDFPAYALANQRPQFKAQDFELLPQMVWHCENPSTTGLEVLQMVLARATAESVKVILTGEGSDEIFGGYERFRRDKVFRLLAILPLSLRRRLLSMPAISSRWPRASRILSAQQHMDLVRYRHLTGLDDIAALTQLFSADLSPALGDPGNLDGALSPPDDFQHWHPFVQLQYYEMKLRLTELITRQLDRTTMAHSLEARVPFLDHGLVEFCAQIPPSLKMHRFREKYILRQAMRGLLPVEIVYRKKRGLASPFQHWLRGKLPDFAEELLSQRCLRDTGYFNPEYVTRLLGQHRAGTGHHGRLLLGVLTTQLWHHLFMRTVP